MKRILLLVLSVVALVSALVIGTTAVASAGTGSQAWYLDSDNHEVITEELVMEKTGEQEGSVDIPAEGGQVWLTDEAALADVTFPDGSWVVYLETEENWGAFCTAVVGGWNPDSGWYAFSTTTGTKISWDNGILIVKIMLAAGTVYTGDYLALRIGNADSSNSHTVITNGSSYLVSPITDPGFPLAELAAGILLGGGLIGLGSYVAIRRKRTGAAHS